MKSVLLFDLDGTISDPVVGIWRSFNYALEHFGYEPCSRETISTYIGPPLDESFRIITGNDSTKSILELVAKYRERFSRIGYSENKLYPGISEAIEFLSQNGASLAICTSKRKDFAETILNLFELRDCFEFISGGDVGITKSQQIQSLISKRLISNNAIMIGDRAIDLIAAHQNGIKSIGVLWGYGSQSELLAQSPALLLSNAHELKRLLTQAHEQSSIAREN